MKATMKTVHNYNRTTSNKPANEVPNDEEQRKSSEYFRQNNTENTDKIKSTVKRRKKKSRNKSGKKSDKGTKSGNREEEHHGTSIEREREKEKSNNPIVLRKDRNRNTPYTSESQGFVIHKISEDIYIRK